MAELNKYEQRHFELVESHLENVQKFLDGNIRNGNTMILDKIYEKVSKIYDIDLHQEEFKKGFRAALKAGKITGIESAGRSGYREAGSKDNAVSVFEPYVENVQEFVDSHIQGDTRMPSGDVYKAFKKEYGCDLKEDVFVKAFRDSVRDGTITGIKGFKRAGYGRVSDGEDFSFTDDGPDKPIVGNTFELNLSDTARLISYDKLSWAYQTRDDINSEWKTRGWHSKFRAGCHSLASTIVDEELKHGKPSDLLSVENRVQQAEDRIANLLELLLFGEKKAV